MKKTGVLFILLGVFVLLMAGFGSAATCIDNVDCTLNASCVINALCEMNYANCGGECAFTNLTLNAPIYSSASLSNGNPLNITVNDTIRGNLSNAINTAGYGTFGLSAANLVIKAKTIDSIAFDAHGGGGGSAGSTGSVTINATNIISTTIDTYASQGSGSGQVGGAVTIYNVDIIRNMSITSYGGAGQGGPYAGADGGALTITNNPSINRLTLVSHGGAGTSAGSGGNGGNGGAVTINATLLNSSSFEVSGGNAGWSSGVPTGRNGGNGGSITLNALDIFNVSFTNPPGSGAGSGSAGTQGSSQMNMTNFYNPETYSISGASVSIQRFLGSNGSSVDYGSSVTFTNSTQNKVVIGDNFVSLNSASLDASLNTSATVTLKLASCVNAIVYYSPVFYTTFAQIKAYGQACNPTSTPACTAMSCVGDTLTFTVSHFDGYGGEGNPAVPEFSDITTLLALGLVVAGFFVIRNRTRN